MLKGEDAKKAEELQRSTKNAVENDDYKTAIELSQELLAIRVQVQGKDHWETVNQESSLTALQRIASLSPENRLAGREAEKEIREARTLQKKGQYAAALDKWKIYFEWC